ncbi:Ig-like domain-containing protein [Nonlabens ponticola]|uniref:SbsA Ig-like domain-containing protein n=1 Tax=Nonlabens ponticola TaxID=2496866 RepID=A0A3S9N1C1_9FLAO|nr:Ig-like domain-containing protein [Nonlabens ponticola]AZQ45142.1 hypothetical protein EJ995_02205 [Nonlabens ponticola]
MIKHSIQIILVAFIALLIVQCAKRGNPTGGPVDETPPEILRATPDNYTTNFENQIIEITFDEYIKLENLERQLVVSPPLKNRPLIKPLGAASRKLTIEILDTLLDNTTYVFSFGQSIVDNTEGNVYPFYKYVFSTGSYIDSLKISGSVTDALNYKTDEFVNVMLYEVDSSYTDSIVYKQQPRYVVNTLDSLTTFTMENLRAGQYKMIALKEPASDLIFNPDRDKIGFISDVISVPTDEVFEVELFKPVLDPKVLRASHEAANRFQVGYAGNLDSMQLKVLPEGLLEQSRIVRQQDIDTLNFWYRPAIVERDSVLLEASYKSYKDTVVVRLREDREVDSLILSKEGQLTLNSPIQLKTNTPISVIDAASMTLIDKDSLVIPFTTKLDSLKNILSIDFEKTESNRYNLQMRPGSIVDMYGTSIDTTTYVYATKTAREYGAFLTTVTGGTKWPVILQIVKEDLSVVAEKTITENGDYDFNYITPGNYYIRSIYDSNANGRYDPGNFLENRQPEEVVYIPALITLLANFDVVETIVLE